MEKKKSLMEILGIGARQGISVNMSAPPKKTDMQSLFAKKDECMAFLYANADCTDLLVVIGETRSLMAAFGNKMDGLERISVKKFQCTPIECFRASESELRNIGDTTLLSEKNGFVIVSIKRGAQTSHEETAQQEEPAQQEKARKGKKNAESA